MTAVLILDLVSGCHARIKKKTLFSNAPAACSVTMCTTQLFKEQNAPISSSGQVVQRAEVVCIAMLTDARIFQLAFQAVQEKGMSTGD